MPLELRTSLLNFRNLGPTAPSTPSYPSRSLAGAPTMPVSYSSALRASFCGPCSYQFQQSLHSFRPQSFPLTSTTQCAPHLPAPSPLYISSRGRFSRWWHFCRWRWLSRESLKVFKLNTSPSRKVSSHGDVAGA